MSSIPLDLQRRFERRWAARFSGPVVSGAPQRPRQRLAAPGESKSKTSGIDRAKRAASLGLFFATAGSCAVSDNYGPDEEVN
jgi:hypothetical protein